MRLAECGRFFTAGPTCLLGPIHQQTPDGKANFTRHSCGAVSVQVTGGLLNLFKTQQKFSKVCQPAICEPTELSHEQAAYQSKK